MAGCCSYTSTRDKLYQYSFTRAGLNTITKNLGEGTTIHCWIPKNPKQTKQNLLLIHGFGANAMWQWDTFIDALTPNFNVYVPDLVFFGESHTTRPERSESFQAQTLMALMTQLGVEKMTVAGISYGGFVGYSLAAQFPDAVERIAICSSGVCLEEKDMSSGMFKVPDIEEACRILVPETPEKLRELVKLSFYKPMWMGLVPSCFLRDYIHVMETEYIEEKRQLIEALFKGRRLANLPKITQSTLIIWGEQDQVFPLELAHRLKRLLEDNAQLKIIKKAGHAVNLEKPKEFFKALNPFLQQQKAGVPKKSKRKIEIMSACID